MEQLILKIVKDILKQAVIIPKYTGKLYIEHLKKAKPRHYEHQQT